MERTALGNDGRTTPCALVTGATGFVGTTLARALRTAGWEVHAIVRPSSPAPRVARLQRMGCSTHPYHGTLVSLAEIVAAVRPTCTWHLAAHAVAHHAAEDVSPLVRGNIEFGALLLEALTQHADAAFVTTGSLWQQHENAAYSPTSLYAATKQAFDVLAVYYAEVRRMRIVECVLADTYGAGDPRQKLLWSLADAVASGTPLELSGDGSQYLDLVHVDDVARAMQCAGDRAMAGVPGLHERWAVRTGIPVSVRELIERYERVRGESVPVIWGARRPRPREMFVPWTAGEVLPDWIPRVSLDVGLAALVAGVPGGDSE